MKETPSFFDPELSKGLTSISTGTSSFPPAAIRKGAVLEQTLIERAQDPLRALGSKLVQTLPQRFLKRQFRDPKGALEDAIIFIEPHVGLAKSLRALHNIPVIVSRISRSLITSERRG